MSMTTKKSIHVTFTPVGEHVNDGETCIAYDAYVGDYKFGRFSRRRDSSMTIDDFFVNMCHNHTSFLQFLINVSLPHNKDEKVSREDAKDYVVTASCE